VSPAGEKRPDAARHALDTLLECALAAEKSQPSTLTGLFSPPPADATLSSSFVVAQIDQHTAGLAYARLSGQPTRNSTTQPPIPALLSQLAESTDQCDPYAMAVLNAVLAKHHAHLLRHAHEPADTIVPFDRPQTVGMVGFIAPLVAALQGAGHRVECIERDSTLWQARPGLRVSGDANRLAACDTVLCTGTVLLNHSLASMRAAARDCRRFVLIGPTVPLAPDCLAACGITHLAGRTVSHSAAFWAACEDGTDWSPHMTKFVLDIKKAPTDVGAP